MLLSTELKIGNIVKPDWNEDFIKVSAKHIVEQHQSDIAKSKYLEPILITKEWLLKLGFIEIEDNSYINGFRYIKQVIGNHDDIATQGIDRNGVWMDGIGTYNWSKTGELVVNTLCRGNYCANSCIHVHELQNLYFSISGKNILIE